MLFINKCDSDVNFWGDLNIVWNFFLIPDRVFNHGINRSLELKSPVQSNSLAVVPWVPKPGATTNWHLAQPERQVVEETMEDEEERSASMEVEEAEAQANTAQSGGESFSRWQQQLQHCVVPELRPNPSTSIMWSWWLRIFDLFLNSSLTIAPQIFESLVFTPLQKDREANEELFPYRFEG